MTTQRTLLLTSWFFPHMTIRWEDAVTLVYLGKADTVVEYAEEISSPSVTMRLPAVVRLRKRFVWRKRGVRFSRVNVFTRDGFRCQYCGERFAMSKLTFDHVVPRAAGGRTEWTNIVTACRPCNSIKGDKLPDRSGMFPRRAPVQPKMLPHTGPVVDVAQAPVEWRDFLVVTM
ncbi:MAG: HNH endonuclease [Myxococcota bacterium]